MNNPEDFDRPGEPDYEQDLINSFRSTESVEHKLIIAKTRCDTFKSSINYMKEFCSNNGDDLLTRKHELLDKPKALSNNLKKVIKTPRLNISNIVEEDDRQYQQLYEKIQLKNSSIDNTPSPRSIIMSPRAITPIVAKDNLPSTRTTIKMDQLEENDKVSNFKLHVESHKSNPTVRPKISMSSIKNLILNDGELINYLSRIEDPMTFINDVEKELSTRSIPKRPIEDTNNHEKKKKRKKTKLRNTNSRCTIINSTNNLNLKDTARVDKIRQFKDKKSTGCKRLPSQCSVIKPVPVQDVVEIYHNDAISSIIERKKLQQQSARHEVRRKMSTKVVTNSRIEKPERDRIDRIHPGKEMEKLKQLQEVVSIPNENNEQEKFNFYLDDVMIAHNYEMPTEASKLKRTNKSYFHRYNVRNIPFVVGTSITPSHNLGLNIQQMLNMMKSRQPTMDGITPILIRKVSNGIKPVSVLLDQMNFQHEESGDTIKPTHLNANKSLHRSYMSFDTKSMISKYSPSCYANIDCLDKMSIKENVPSRQNINETGRKKDDLKGLQKVMIVLHDQFEQLQTKYDKVQTKVQKFQNDKSAIEELSKLETKLNEKEEEINAFIGLYKQVEELKQQMKQLREKNSVMRIRSRNPVSLTPVLSGQPTQGSCLSSLQLMALLRQIQMCQKQLQYTS